VLGVPGQVSDFVRRALRFLEPYGVVYRRQARDRARVDAERRARYATVKAALAQSREPVRDYDELMVLAIEAGVDRERLAAGSITVASLDFILERINGGPGLHIGNYAGISLTYLAAHTDDLVVAIDPNIVRWGPTRAQDVVVRLLQAAAVDDRVLLLCGYSLERNPSYSGRIVDGYDPSVEYRNEAAPVAVLRNLRALGIRFAWALVDGNHDGSYVGAELERLEDLLSDDGVVFLDDCTPAWPEVLAAFDHAGTGWYADGHDGRVGVLRRQSQPQVVP